MDLDETYTHIPNTHMHTHIQNEILCDQIHTQLCTKMYIPY